MGSENLSEFFMESEFTNDIFSILEAFENGSTDCNNPVISNDESFEFQRSSAYSPPLTAFLESETDPEPADSTCKRQKLSAATTTAASASHITVERNRRKQMNEHLTVLRSLMPCFYVKRGDQASIIGGVVDYIKELQQVLQSLEVKKQRKSYAADVLSPRPSPGLSPRKPPLSPRLISLPMSPSTPQSSSPYKPRLHINLQTACTFLNVSPSLPSPAELSPCNSSTSSSINDSVNELVASSRSAVAEVEVKFCGPNLLLKTVSHRIPGQVVKIVSALEDLALEILQVNINKLDEKMLNCFTIKNKTNISLSGILDVDISQPQIGIECQLSAEELAQQIQQTFC